MIVIILVGVLAAIAIPRYVDLRENAMRANAQATLDAGRAAVLLDFADQMLNQGTYTNALTDQTSENSRLVNPDVSDLEGELESAPNYPSNGAYNSPSGKGFRWWLVTQGINSGGASAPQPPVIDALIDTTCAVADSQANKANDDCWMSKL